MLSKFVQIDILCSLLMFVEQNSINTQLLTGPSIAGGVHWTAGDPMDSDSESEDEIGSIAPPPQVDENSR